MYQDEIYYKLNWPPVSAMPGQHRSAALGDGFEFDTHAPLGDGVDPRRVDLLASCRDPLERLLVRRYRQTSAVDITIIADLSASMLLTRAIRKADLLAHLTRALARSVYRNGDYFAFYGCAESLIPGFVCPRTRDSYSGLQIAEKLLAIGDHDEYFDSTVLSASAIDKLIPALPPRRGMVFLVSDFYMPLATIDSILQLLGKHRIVPVLLQDSNETNSPPAFGLTEMLDVETGSRVSYFMRPGLRKRYMSAFTQHRQAIRELCNRRGCPLLEIVDKFVADDVSRYFLAC